MKNTTFLFTLLFFGVFLLAIPEAKACAEKHDEIIVFKPSNDTMHVSYEKYLPIAKEIITKHLRKARLYSNLALGMIPLNIITFGLAYLAGVVFTIIAGIEVYRIRKLQNKFPQLEDDPQIASKIRNCYIRFCLSILSFLGFVIGVLLLISFLFFFPTNFLLVFFVCALGMGLFLLMDWLVFRTKSYLR
ncbi:MAG: hypothetical protein ACOYOA_08515 [Saprospiraceae bacterium]